MKHLFSLLCIPLVLLFAGAKAQTYIEYTYDAAGNRTQRFVIYLKLADTTNLQDSASQVNQPADSSSVFSENIGNCKVSVFPNPIQGKLTLRIINTLSPAQTPETKTFIYNESGTLLKQTVATEPEQSIDFSMFTVGVYYLKVMVNNADKTFKIIKTN
ncbi:MAG: T9SS type A sorting domain-containing protein [Bacteroidales bacterium]